MTYSGEGWQGSAELFERLGPWQRWKHAVGMCLLEAIGQRDFLSWERYNNQWRAVFTRPLTDEELQAFSMAIVITMPLWPGAR